MHGCATHACGRVRLASPRARLGGSKYALADLLSDKVGQGRLWASEAQETALAAALGKSLLHLGMSFKGSSPLARFLELFCPPALLHMLHEQRQPVSHSLLRKAPAL